MLTDAVLRRRCCACLNSNPTRGQDTPEMAMREDRNIAFQRPEPGNHPICASGNLGGRFAPWASVSKDIPVWPCLANIHRALSLVVAVVPLREIRFDFCNVTQPGQLACSP